MRKASARLQEADVASRVKKPLPIRNVVAVAAGIFCLWLILNALIELKFQIKPQFKYAQDFSDGLAGVYIGNDEDGKWGYIDKTGSMVIAPQFSDARPFLDGLALVRSGTGESGKYGCIDKSGIMATAPTFDKVWHSYDGLTAIEINGKWGFVNTKCEIVIAPQFKKLLGTSKSFSEGLAAVLIDGQWGYIDKNGNVAISPRFSHASQFSDGLAKVRVGDSRSGTVGYINRQGQMVIASQFYKNWDFSEEFAVVSVGDYRSERYGFINRQGQVVVKPQYESVRSMRNGLAAVCVPREGERLCRWGYIDKMGRTVITPRFLEIGLDGSFSDGLAIVRTSSRRGSGKVGYIDTQGNYAIWPIFEMAHPFSEQLAAVKFGGKWGYINKDFRLP